jgi:hypothetical protein
MSDVEYYISLYFYFSFPNTSPQADRCSGHVLGNAKQIKHINNWKYFLHYMLLYIINNNKDIYQKIKEKEYGFEGEVEE